MTTARTTPAQKPRGRTRKSTFPLVSVGIFFLSEWFIKTLSYLRGGVCWMEIGGGGVHRKAAGFRKPALQLPERCVLVQLNWRRKLPLRELGMVANRRDGPRQRLHDQVRLVEMNLVSAAGCGDVNSV